MNKRNTVYLWVLLTIAEFTGIVYSGTVVDPLEVHFLNLRPGVIDRPFRVADNHIQIKSGEGWQTVEGKLPQNVPDGEGSFILGAPVIISNFVQQDFSPISEGFLPVFGALSNGVLWAVVEKRHLDGGTVVTSFTVLCRDSATMPFKQRGMFSLRNNPYNLCLSEVYFVNTNVLAIALRSSRNSYENQIVLYQTETNKVVGSRECSLFEFLPNESSLWLVDPVPNSINMNEALKDFTSRAINVSLTNSVEMPEAIRDLSGIVQ